MKDDVVKDSAENNEIVDDGFNDILDSLDDDLDGIELESEVILEASSTETGIEETVEDSDIIEPIEVESEDIGYVESEVIDVDVRPDFELADSGTTAETAETFENLPKVSQKVNQISENLPKVSSEDYFDDDEEFLAGDDVEIHDDNVLSIFRQEDNVVSVELMNLYTNDGDLRNKFQLRNDPPVMIIKSSDGQLAQFLLTKNFVNGLNGKFDDVHRAYFGLESKSSRDRKRKLSEGESSGKGFIDNTRDWVIENKFKSVLLLLVLLLVVFGIVF